MVVRLHSSVQAPWYGHPRLAPWYGHPRLAPWYGHPRLAPWYGHPRLAPRYGHPRLAPWYGHPRLAPWYGHPRLAPWYGHPRLAHGMVIPGWPHGMVIPGWLCLQSIGQTRSLDTTLPFQNFVKLINYIHTPQKKNRFLSIMLHQRHQRFSDCQFNRGWEVYSMSLI